MKSKRGKKGQIRISFGMIFSVILIIAFIAVAIYVIGIFLGWKKCITTGMFKQDLQDSVNRAWVSEDTTDVFEETLNSNIQKVCFVDFFSSKKGKNKEYYDKFKFNMQNNMFFMPLEKACIAGFEIEHINIEKITERENPYCVDNVQGKVEIKIEKKFNENLVTIS